MTFQASEAGLQRHSFEGAATICAIAQ